MVKNIEPKLRKIGDYLKLEPGTSFIIPEYQRAYSWEIGHCDQLWQDIEDYINSGNRDPYFFGTIIINCEDDDTKLGLIDGQQRTTTFLLLLKALLLKINIEINKTGKDDESENLYKGLRQRRSDIIEILYKVDPDTVPDNPNPQRDKEIYKNKNILLQNSSINESYKTELNTILQAVDYKEIESNVKKIPYKQKDNKYTNFFKNFKYFYEKITKLSSSELNNIAKALIGQCEVIEIKSWQVEQAITMFNSLNSDGLPLCDSDIISAKLYATAKRQGSEKKFKELWEELQVEIKKLNSINIDIDSILSQQMYYERARNQEFKTESGSIDVTIPGVRRYFTEINKNLLSDPITLCENMINLSKIWIKISDYPLAQILFKFNENSKLFLASYLYRFNENNVCEEKTNTIFECMLRLFTILELVETGYSSSKFKTFLVREILKFVDNTIPLEEIKADFDKHISENWDKENLREEIMEYDKNSLVYLNEYLFAKETQRNFKLGSKYDIEHIMPNSGRNHPEIRQDADINSEEEFKEIVNKLGNKILLEEKINRSTSNEWFRSKISTGYRDSSFPLVQELVDKYKNEDKYFWKKEDINKATEKAADRILRFIFGNN